MYPFADIVPRPFSFFFRVDSYYPYHLIIEPIGHSVYVFGLWYPAGIAVSHVRLRNVQSAGSPCMTMLSDRSVDIGSISFSWSLGIPHCRCIWSHISSGANFPSTLSFLLSHATSSIWKPCPTSSFSAMIFSVAWVFSLSQSSSQQKLIVGDLKVGITPRIGDCFNTLHEYVYLS